jgi:GntR family transcriptional regulator / MocR family aminotransferase
MPKAHEQPTDLVYRRVYDRLRLSIMGGRLKPGERVPSARALAAQLGVSRGTIDLAYAVLSGEGFLVTHGARGTFVSPALPVRTDAEPRLGIPPALNTLTGTTVQPVLAFWVGLPSIDLFPRKIWSRLVAREVRGLGQEDYGYPLGAGDRRLKSALVSYLSVSRGIACSADQIIITGGYQGAVGLVGRLMLSGGDKVWVEDPGYYGTHRSLHWVGAQAVPVTVDAHGLDVEVGLRRAPDAAMCIVTPSNQFPLGVAMSLPRRKALLDWAASEHGWILEDDYDSEFYYEGRLLPALKALDREDRVFYVGTFSKTLFPGLRLGYVVTPKSESDRFRAASWALEGGRSSLEQVVVADFIAEGYFARHLKKMRTIYAARRTAAVNALREELGFLMTFDLRPGGLHVIGRVSDEIDDAELAARALAAGYRPIALSSLSPEPDAARGLLLGFTNVLESHALQQARQFRRVLGL